MTTTTMLTRASLQAQRTLAMVEDPTGEELARHILDYNPKAPGQRLFTSTMIMNSLGVTGTLEAEIPSGLPGEAQVMAARAPVLAAIPWPAGLAPTTTVIQPSPTPDDPLPAADVLVVTWTVAEAEALADVLTPGQPRSDWHVYAHRYAEHFKDLIRNGAPARHYGRMGVYASTRIGDLNVLCVKSDLHLSQDGPKLPVREFWAQMINEVKPRLVITTGTAGGVGASTDLGDVVVARTVRFDCQRTFAHADFAKTRYHDPSSHAAATHYGIVTGQLFGPNAGQVPGGATPRIWHAAHPAVEVLTTDFFGFDNTTDSYGLRAADPQARAVEMGDAVLGLVASTDVDQPPAWVIVRNASDPQMDGSVPLREQAATAARIYEKYGYWTTVNSSIVTWALIADLIPAAVPAVPAGAQAETEAERSAQG